MIEQVNGFITPMKEWDAVGKNDGKITGTENGTKSVFQSVLEDTIQNVYDTQKDVEQKQYLLATGQLEDAHSLPIAQAKAELSLEVMISLRNKAIEAYNEILKMSSKCLIFAIYGNAKDEWNSAEFKRSMAEDARENKENDRSHCSRDDYPGGSWTSGPEYGHEKRIQYLVYRNELGRCPGSCKSSSG